MIRGAVVWAAAVAALLPTLPVGAEPHPQAARVLAIGGSITEIIYALGQQDRLIARDTTSSYPAEAQALPDVGYMRALSPEGVLSVGPDLILSEEGAGPPEAIAVLQEAGVPFETIAGGTDADGLIGKVQAVADTLGVPEAAAAPIAALRADLDQLATLAAQAGPTKKKILFVLFVTDGRITASGKGTEADAIIRMAGAENAIGDVDGYKPLTDEAITAAAPDIILTMTRGDAGDDMDAKAAELLAMPAIATTPAGKAGKVITMDGLYLLGFGPRTGKAGLDLHDAVYGEP
ncbi:ABC transporter substrate-binding protein [Paracoccus sp. M683]|uniref:heme/hemin ABC transporter substrate-binding protein n=1 Tax=Paracoccus sp. M683 TaxID=2594268 RepID=UPI00117E5688|nr:ABC transporter substrate-binding protein [Paracoccus sp. M683]TRW97841.1 ABC transporter substrate-binding protein [Paracoccus sp. M683]